MVICCKFRRGLFRAVAAVDLVVALHQRKFGRALICWGNLRHG